MTELLQPFLPYDPAETLTSFIRRLSYFHTGQGPQRLLADRGIAPVEINLGSKSALDAVSKMSGVCPDVLQAGTIGRIDRCRIFRSERWSREFVTPEGARFCAACLLQDGGEADIGAFKIRILWRLRPILTCPIHDLRLSTLAGLTSKDDLDGAQVSPQDLRALISEPISQRPTALETWVFDRLNGKATNGGQWLDQQSIEQGVRVCEMLGCVLSHGIHVNLKDMTADALRLNAVVGFDFARQGELHVMQAIDRIRASSNSRAGQAGPKAMYGRLYEWLAHTTPVVDHGPIRELLRNHILTHTEIEPGEFLLGQIVTERRCHSVYSLAVAMKINPKRLRKVLEQKGLVPANCSDVALNLLVFPAAEMEAFCQNLLGSVSLALLPLAIGGSRTQVTSIYQNGILRAIVDRDLSLGIGKIDFAKSDVADFLGQIERLPIAHSVDEMVDLTLASKKSSLSTGELISRIFAGDLKAFRTGAPIGLGSIRISAGCLAKMRLVSE